MRSNVDGVLEGHVVALGAQGKAGNGHRDDGALEPHVEEHILWLWVHLKLRKLVKVAGGHS
eukprot:1137795-Pelagomonas_calceolata.AAC.8